MRRRRLVVSAVVLGLAIVGVLVWTLRQPPQLMQKPPSASFVVEEPPTRRPANPSFGEARLAQFQADAESACQCARGSPHRKQACWAKFKHETSRYDPIEEVSMCYPIAPNKICFGDTDVCVTTEFSQVEDASFCTPAEAGAAAALYREADRRHSIDRSSESAEKALVRLSAALARGEPVPSGKVAGCGG